MGGSATLDWSASDQDAPVRGVSPRSARWATAETRANAQFSGTRETAGVTEEPHRPRSATSFDASGTTISLMLIVPDAKEAIEWYKRALGATELWNLGGVAGLEFRGAPFFLHEVNPDNPAETSPDQAGVTSTRVELFVDDPDAVVERAVAAGAIAGSPVEDRRSPWGTHRQGGFHDPFGHNWSVGDKSPLTKFRA